MLVKRAMEAWLNTNSTATGGASSPLSGGAVVDEREERVLAYAKVRGAFTTSPIQTTQPGPPWQVSGSDGFNFKLVPMVVCLLFVTVVRSTPSPVTSGACCCGPCPRLPWPPPSSRPPPRAPCPSRPSSAPGCCCSSTRAAASRPSPTSLRAGFRTCCGPCCWPRSCCPSPSPCCCTVLLECGHMMVILRFTVELRNG